VPNNLTMEQAQSKDYLTSLLNKNLRITTSDARMFLGQFKCTDSDRNIILAHTFEYRIPPPPKDLGENKEPVTLDLTSRYLGLVVVPGEYITQIEVEEFASQMKGKSLSGNQAALREEESVV
ncbi:N-alpha-acetyltransferase,NatC auxiliary subunit, partial [Lachnellula occidentalis]